SLVFRPATGRAEGCDLQPVSGEPPVTLSYTTSTVPRGCVSSSSLRTNHEVHVLNVKWSKPVLLEQMSLCWTSQDTLFPWEHGLVLGQQLSRATDTWWGPYWLPLGLQDSHHKEKITADLSPKGLTVLSEEQLLSWAQTTYGGITSYSELRDPRWIQLRLGEDAGSPSNCVPQDHFNATLHLEAEVSFHGVKSCSPRDAQSTGAAHIIHLQTEPSSLVTEVNLSLSCPERPDRSQILILKSRANFTWSLSFKKGQISFLVSGYYKIPMMSHTRRGELLPDTEQGLIAEAFQRNYSIIASYSAIPFSTRISLEIPEHETVKKTPVTTFSPPATELQPHQLLHMLKPWKCTDETMEIIIIRAHLTVRRAMKGVDIKDITLKDINCQAEKNDTHFMLKSPLRQCKTSVDRDYAENELILNLAKGTELHSVRVDFKCKILRELLLQLFPTAAFKEPRTELEINKEAFVQVLPPSQCPAWGSPVIPGPVTLMDFPHLPPPMAGIHKVGGPTGRPAAEGLLAGGTRAGAALSPHRGAGLSPLSPQTLPLQNTTFEKGLEVTVKDTWQPPNNRGLGLAAVLGITFGAFLIGALLTAGLWYIYSHTRPTSKLQPVSSTAPASESSSTNHSIGSTQSTPCSTSSMA
ncbi:EGLN protein, partial [Pitta sordida]|nr:EGLN protein [Pitta sordida]